MTLLLAALAYSALITVICVIVQGANFDLSAENRNLRARLRSVHRADERAIR